MARTSRSTDWKITRQPKFLGVQKDLLRLGIKEHVQGGLECVFPSQCPCCGQPLQVEVGKTGSKVYEISETGGYGKVVRDNDDPFFESPVFICTGKECEFEFRIDELGDINDQKTKVYENAQ